MFQWLFNRVRFFNFINVSFVRFEIVIAFQSLFMLDVHLNKIDVKSDYIWSMMQVYAARNVIVELLLTSSNVMIEFGIIYELDYVLRYKKRHSF